jgi:NitT/TauT family transport system ATP-binding protein
MTPLLVADDIKKVYHTNQGQVEALAGVSFEVEAGEFLCLVGPSGCGKTTLLRILGALLAPTSGGVRLNGQGLTSPRREISFVFQKANLMPWRTVLDNVALPLEVQGVDKTEARHRSQELLRLVGLPDFERAYPAQLSGGMQQRVAIARALIYGPAILLLDEPFGSLDALTREVLNVELLRIWRMRRQTGVMVTHSIQEAVFLADRVLVMSPRPGRIKAALPISLPRPRCLEMISDERFGFFSQRVRHAISLNNGVCENAARH